MKKRLPAFTITELIVVALLTILTAAAALQAIHFLNTQFFDYQKDSGVYLKMSQFKTIFGRDFTEAKIVEEKNNTIYMRSEKRQIAYSFEENQVTRELLFEEGYIETFSLNNHTIECSLNKQMVSNGLIDFIAISFDAEEKKHEIIFSKTYSAQELCSIDYANRH
jgi:hypothetical protein